MTDPWTLIETGQYEAAISEYSRLYEEKGRKFYLNNRGRAYLLVGNYNAALRDFRHSIETDDPRYRSTGDYVYAGISLWYLNRPDEAIPIWRAGLSAPYTDAAGGVEIPALLLYAGCRLRDFALQTEAVQLLKKHWRNFLRQQKRRAQQSRPSHEDFVHPGLVAWPGAIVPFLLYEIDRTELPLIPVLVRPAHPRLGNLRDIASIRRCHRINSGNFGQNPHPEARPSPQILHHERNNVSTHSDDPPKRCVVHDFCAGREMRCLALPLFFQPSKLLLNMIRDWHGRR